MGERRCDEVEVGGGIHEHRESIIYPESEANIVEVLDRRSKSMTGAKPARG
jgi:hypothetical protein